MLLTVALRLLAGRPKGLRGKRQHGIGKKPSPYGPMTTGGKRWGRESRGADLTSRSGMGGILVSADASAFAGLPTLLTLLPKRSRWPLPGDDGDS